MRTVFLRRGLVALFAAAVTFGAITQAQAETLRIGYQKYGTLVLLKAKGTLEKRLAAQGVDVQWTEFPGGPQLLEGLNVGSIDFGVTGETPPVFAQAAGADLLYVAYEPPAPHSEAILVPKDSPIKSVAELKGKKVVLNKGSNVHYLLVRALEDAGLKYSDIQTVFLPPADARAAFERGAVDAWVIWDPFQAAAEAATGARTIADGTGLVANHQFYIAERAFADTHGEALDSVIAAVAEIDAWAKDNTDAVAAQLSPAVGIPAPILTVALKRQTYGVKPLDPGVVAEQQRIADTLHRLGLLPKPVVIADAVRKAGS